MGVSTSLTFSISPPNAVQILTKRFRVAHLKTNEQKHTQSHSISTIPYLDNIITQHNRELIIVIDAHVHPLQEINDHAIRSRVEEMDPVAYEKKLRRNRRSGEEIEEAEKAHISKFITQRLPKSSS